MKPMMLAVMVVGALFAAGAGRQEKGINDEEKIQGTWSVVALERGGFEVTEDFVKQAKLVITPDKVKVQADGKDMQVGYKLDASKKPAHMDILESSGGKDVVFQGIYALDGDDLKICFAP